MSNLSVVVRRQLRHQVRELLGHVNPHKELVQQSRCCLWLSCHTHPDFYTQPSPNAGERLGHPARCVHSVRFAGSLRPRTATPNGATAVAAPAARLAILAPPRATAPLIARSTVTDRIRGSTLSETLPRHKAGLAGGEVGHQVADPRVTLTNVDNRNVQGGIQLGTQLPECFLRTVLSG